MNLRKAEREVKVTVEAGSLQGSMTSRLMDGEVGVEAKVELWKSERVVEKEENTGTENIEADRGVQNTGVNTVSTNLVAKGVRMMRAETVKMNLVNLTNQIKKVPKNLTKLILREKIKNMKNQTKSKKNDQVDDRVKKDL